MIQDSGFNILKHPEMFEALNVKIVANAYSIFDAPYGVSYAEQFINGRSLKPTDNDVWDLIMLQWNLYSNKAPQLGGGDKLYNRDFPWYDSDKLDLLYKDSNNRRQALFFLFFLDNATFDMKQGKVIAGLEGARIALIQAEEEYEAISSLYPDGKLKLEVRYPQPATYYLPPSFFYYGWVIDRGYHGLPNTHIQYLGLTPDEHAEIRGSILRGRIEETWDVIKDLDGIDQFITKNSKSWHLMKFVVGYEDWRPWVVKRMFEPYIINYTRPQVLKAFGFPIHFVLIYPAPAGAAGYEWVVSLPDYVAESLKSKFGDKIIIGLGNGFGLYLCKDGLLKDGIKQIFGFSGGSILYRKEDGSIDISMVLLPNFGVYFVKK